MNISNNSLINQSSVPVSAVGASVANARAQNQLTNSDVYSKLGDVGSSINWLNNVTQKNSAQSQANAREQMQFQREQNALAMAYNSAEAKKNRDWQELMSNTAHQREVNDLKAAGLNPILSANSGAAVGSGATASGVSSAGAAGQVDTSLASGAASLFGTVLNSLTALKAQDVSAKTNMEIARIQSDTSKFLGVLSADTGRYAADRSSAATRYSADSSAAASRYSADSQFASNKYSTDRDTFARIYSADRSYDSSTYSASNAAKAVIDSANISSATAKAVAEINRIATLETQESKNRASIDLQNDAQNYDEWKNRVNPQSYAGIISALTSNITSLLYPSSTFAFGSNNAYKSKG